MCLVFPSRIRSRMKTEFTLQCASFNEKKRKRKKKRKRGSHQTKFFSSSVGGGVHNRDLAATSPRENIVTRIRRSCTLFAAFSTPVRRNEVCGTVSQTCRHLRLPSRAHGTTRIFRFHGKRSACTRETCAQTDTYTKRDARPCAHVAEELRDV